MQNSDSSIDPSDKKWDDVERIVVDEIGKAKKYVETNISSDRQKRWNRYYARKHGNEKRGRSQYISRDVMETVEWLMPGLVRTFLTGDPKVEIYIEGQDPIIGKALMIKINEDLAYDDESSLFFSDYVWMKDALISGTAVQKIMWAKDYDFIKKTFGRLSTEQMVQLDGDEDVEMLDWEEVQVSPYQSEWSNVKTKIRRLRRNILDIIPVPYWEFIWAEDSRFLNDEHGKGHSTRVSIDYLRRMNKRYSDEGSEEPFFKGLEKLESEILSIDDEKDDITIGKTMVTLTEWYDRLDINGDGFLEDVICWCCTDYPNESERMQHEDRIDQEEDDKNGPGGTLLRYEVNEDGFIGLSELRPIIDPYKMQGIAWVDMLTDLANLKTMVMRRILDNFDFVNLGRWFKKPNSQVNLRQLYDHVPGDVIEGELGVDIQKEPVQPFDSSALTLMEYIDRIKEERTGQNRVNQGYDTASANQTATGISLLQSAAQKLTGLVERTFAETGFRDRYRKAAILYQKNITEPFSVKVNGRDITVNPEQLQGKVKTCVNMAMEAQTGYDDAQKIERMFSFLIQINQQYPGLITPQQIHNLAAKYVTALGFNQVSDYISDLQAFVQSVQQAIATNQKQVQLQTQIAVQSSQNDALAAKVKEAELQLKAQDLNLDYQSDQAEEQNKLIMKQMDIEQKDRSDQLDFELGMFNALSRGTNVRAA